LTGSSSRAIGMVGLGAMGRPIAEHIAQAGFTVLAHVLGEVGAGQVAKSANNLIHWAQIAAIDESLRFASALGVDPAALRTALEAGLTDSRTLREIEFMRFTWYAKVIEIAAEIAAGAGRDLPVARLSRKLLDVITVASVHDPLGLSLD
jgi:3-hydroxyisobutyrate dehydrogenase-like beta-hydroxyacid dehydrogenase